MATALSASRGSGDPVVRGLKIGRTFCRSAITVLRSHRRKVYQQLYKDAKHTLAELRGSADSLPNYSPGIVFVNSAPPNYPICRLAERVCHMVVHAMETCPSDHVYWDWPTSWHDHVSEVMRIGVDSSEISDRECMWRWRDLTGRRRRGRNVKAAFEAAWLSGNFKFARQLIQDK